MGFSINFVISLLLNAFMIYRFYSLGGELYFKFEFRVNFFFLFKKGILITNNFEQRGEAFISTIVSSSNNIKRSKHVKAASTYGILRCNSDLFEP